MSTEEDGTVPGRVPLAALASFREYRMYLGPEFWLITYKDADFIRIMRRSQHGNGFCLLCCEVLWELLTGQRTAIRERWALSEALYKADGKELSLKAAAASRKIIEFWSSSGRKGKPSQSQKTPATAKRSPLTIAVITRELIRLIRTEGFTGRAAQPGDQVFQFDINLIVHWQDLNVSLDDFSGQVLSKAVAFLIHRADIGIVLVTDHLPAPTHGSVTAWCNESYDGITLRGVLDYDIISDQYYVKWDMRFFR